MAYNSKNKNRERRHIIEVYNKYKQEDIPDTYIVRHKFKEHGIFISLRTWVSIKGMKPSELAEPNNNQTTLFG
jgi:hypothetical protein